MPVFEWAEWTFEPAEWRLVRAGAGVSLSNKSLALLAVLLERAPGLVSKNDILALVWEDAVVEEGNIAFHIAMLRKTLDAAGAASCIETVRGQGYRFVAPVTRRLATGTPLLDAVPSIPAPVPVPAPSSSALPPSSLPFELPHSSGRDRRALVRLWPAALTAVAAGLIAWPSLANLDGRVREVVVLPARGTDRALVEGVADAVAAQLTRETTVRSRVSTWAGASETPLEAGRRLEAETVLTSIVDRSRDPWRVSVQLTRTHDGQRLWSWTFDLPASVPAPASAIGTRTAAGLGRHLGVLAPSRAEAGVNAAAFDLVLQAREHWRLRTPHAVQQAIALYERALAIDPGYALAYAGLADCYNLTMSGLPPGVRYAKAKQNIERALALDPDHASGLTALAFLRYKFEWRWQEAEAAFKQAIAADPSYALAHHWYGEFLGLMGRYDEAIAELSLAQALEPNSLAVESDLVPPLLRAGRMPEARAVVEAAAAANPNWHWVPRRMAEVLAAEGREKESLEELWRALVLTGASLSEIDELRAAYRAGGLPVLLRLEVARLLAAEEASPGTFMAATNLSRVYARLGERADALRWIAIALDRREDAAILLLTHPDYDSLRGDPEYGRLLARVGLEPLAPR